MRAGTSIDLCICLPVYLLPGDVDGNGVSQGEGSRGVDPFPATVLSIVELSIFSEVLVHIQTHVPSLYVAGSTV